MEWSHGWKGDDAIFFQGRKIQSSNQKPISDNLYYRR